MAKANEVEEEEVVGNKDLNNNLSCFLFRKITLVRATLFLTRRHFGTS